MVRSKVSEGEVVLVHEDNVKKSNWKMGKVVGLIIGKHSEVRGAELKLITKGRTVFVNRALQKLYPLDVRSVTIKLMGLAQTQWEMKVIKRLHVGKSHVGQLHWICVGKHEPCSITNCLF